LSFEENSPAPRDETFKIGITGSLMFPVEYGLPPVSKIEIILPDGSLPTGSISYRIINYQKEKDDFDRTVGVESFIRGGTFTAEDWFNSDYPLLNDFLESYE
jgi:hypothetical protein